MQALSTRPFILILLGAASLILRTEAAVLIGATASTTMGNASVFYSPTYLTDRSGLSTPISLTSTHGNSYQYTMWCSGGSQKTGSVLFDFGQVYALDAMSIWNYNWSVLLGRGVRHFSLESSLNGVDYSVLLGSTEMTEGTGSSALSPSAGLTFSGDPARYVRLNIIDNWGDPDYCGLSEVLFSGTTSVPEPRQWIVMSVPLLYAAARLYRRRGQSRYPRGL
jgi:hypothetical protein